MTDGQERDIEWVGPRPEDRRQRRDYRKHGVEVLMDDGSWHPAHVEVVGRGDSAQTGGDGWRFVRYVGLGWWAAPDEWRLADA